MGLTNHSMGGYAAQNRIPTAHSNQNSKTIALAGNPNVGKSTLFNSLTGMHQHTGNWAGKTVACAQGYCQKGSLTYTLVDLPGAYSLSAQSPEEAVARDYICFGAHDGVVVVCDATCLERSLYLVLQAMELCSHTVVCVNLLDEAAKKGIGLTLPLLEQRLGVPVVGVVARKKKTLQGLLGALEEPSISEAAFSVPYPQMVEEALGLLEPILRAFDLKSLNSRGVALQLLKNQGDFVTQLDTYLGFSLTQQPQVQKALEDAQSLLAGLDIDQQTTAGLVLAAEALCLEVVTSTGSCDGFDRKIDKAITSKWLGYPLMLCLLGGIFWLTIIGANYPSQALASLLFQLQEQLSQGFFALGAPDWLHGVVVLGAYRVLAWVVSVMLPPMAIFFPLFTLLEDVGYLPRVAYNLDKPFHKCGSCGKQALTACMGFGCNAAGVMGCRIIDSPRERLLAILTNTFVPCNGRFPTLIALLTMFFVGTQTSMGSLLSTLLLTLLILLGIGATFFSTWLLSKTLLKGEPSTFALELPPYRRPQIGRVLVRSVFDRTLFVLGRAVCAAVPAGVIIWILSNVYVDSHSLLQYCTDFLHPFAQLLGLDGVILMAFILGLPANEIVLPIILMAYTAQGSLSEIDSLSQIQALLVQNGWTWVTALCTMLFSLLHWPCSTTLMTIHAETRSTKWTLVSFLLPTIMGIAVCFAVATVARLLT